MQRRESFLPAFFVVSFLCVIILVLSLSGNLKFLSSFLEKGTAAVQAGTFGLFQKLPFMTEDARIKKLENENLELLSLLSAFEKLKKENQALSDQFQISYPKSTQLLQANIIGVPDFIPGISTPTVFILDRGMKDNVRKGDAVIIKNSLVGVISQVSENLSKVNTLNNSTFSLTAKTQNEAVGIITGGTTLALDGILLSEDIKAGELVLTKGNINNDGIGVLPDLVIGKIISVEKNPSDLFQRAKIESSINFANLTSVFIYIQTK
jgi:cell shape-determining protein MreC